LTETIVVIAQNTNEMTPYTPASFGLTAPSWAAKTVWRAYRGLVPISPKTTPSAPTVRVAVPAVRTALRLDSVGFPPAMDRRA